MSLNDWRDKFRAFGNYIRQSLTLPWFFVDLSIESKGSIQWEGESTHFPGGSAALSDKGADHRVANTQWESDLRIAVERDDHLWDHAWQIIQINVSIDIALNSLFQSVRTTVGDRHSRSDTDLPVTELLLGHGKSWLNGAEQNTLVVLIAVGKGSQWVHGSESITAKEFIEALDQQVLTNQLGAVVWWHWWSGSKAWVRSHRTVGVGSWQTAWRWRAWTWDWSGADWYHAWRSWPGADQEISLDGILFCQDNICHAYILDFILQVADLLLQFAGELGSWVKGSNLELSCSELCL